MVNVSCKRNSNLTGFTCLRCKNNLDVDDYFEGCPSCLAEGFPSSVAATYQLSNISILSGKEQYEAMMPYITYPNLGEGQTPLVSMAKVADQLKLSALHIKCEGQNPTGSHKDRVSAFAIARAVDVGAKTVVAASSGNAGASVAAYAAAAGLASVIVTTPTINPIWRRAIEMAGGQLLATTEAADRWKYIKCKVKEEQWFPITNYLNPPVGSNHFGIEGLKAIAFELHEAVGANTIDAILIPTTRGDLLWGIYQGFKQLAAITKTTIIPRLYAVEPFARITTVLAGADYRDSFPGGTDMVSLGGTTVTWQALEAIRDSNGGAVVVSDAEAQVDQQLLARQGMYLELSAAASLTGLRQLLDRAIVKPDERVILIGSSNGYKELTLPETQLPLVSISS